MLRFRDWPQIHEPCGILRPMGLDPPHDPWKEPDHSQGTHKQTCSITWTCKGSLLLAGLPPSSALTPTHRCRDGKTPVPLLGLPGQGTGVYRT